MELRSLKKRAEDGPREYRLLQTFDQRYITATMNAERIWHYESSSRLDIQPAGSFFVYISAPKPKGYSKASSGVKHPKGKALSYLRVSLSADCTTEALKASLETVPHVTAIKNQIRPVVVRCHVIMPQLTLPRLEYDDSSINLSTVMKPLMTPPVTAAVACLSFFAASTPKAVPSPLFPVRLHSVDPERTSSDTSDDDEASLSTYQSSSDGSLPHFDYAEGFEYIDDLPPPASSRQFPFSSSVYQGFTFPETDENVSMQCANF